MVQREQYGRFGIASSAAKMTAGFWAWGCHGETVADSALAEPAEPVWFRYGFTREEAIAALKAELDQVPA